jgi:hypothetical protein
MGKTLFVVERGFSNYLQRLFSVNVVKYVLKALAISR